jgi:GcrA cell cycle regulator
MSWTEQKIQMLRDMWGNGFSASEIAGKLGGLTRNAVIGKAHRLKLSGKPSTPRAESSKPTVLRMKPSDQARSLDAKKMLLRAAPSLPAPSAEPRFMTLKRVVDAVPAPSAAAVAPVRSSERQCRWPYGDPRSSDFKFCGCRAVETLPYCHEHAKVAYQNYGRRRREEDQAEIAGSVVA